jgi:7,8-dihydroneopterin aldolase/epimerase/oxygenase
VSDRLEIRGLRVHAYHGVHERERVEGQPFVVDAVLTYDASTAARTDDLHDAVDYAALSDRLAAIVGGEPVALIETLAARLAAACLEDARVQSVSVTVHKPQAPLSVSFEDVAVTVTRSRE